MLLCNYVDSQDTIMSTLMSVTVVALPIRNKFVVMGFMPLPIYLAYVKIPGLFLFCSWLNRLSMPTGWIGYTGSTLDMLTSWYFIPFIPFYFCYGFPHISIEQRPTLYKYISQTRVSFREMCIVVSKCSHLLIGLCL